MSKTPQKKQESHHVTKKSLRDLVNKHGHAVVKFTATWCAPCKTYAPVFDKVRSANKSDSVAFVTVDIDESEELAEDLAITSVPATVFLRADDKGKFPWFETGRVIGVLSKAELEKLVKANT